MGSNPDLVAVRQQCQPPSLLVLKVPKCAKKISLTPLHCYQQPEPSIWNRMDPRFHVEEWKSCCIRQHGPGVLFCCCSASKFDMCALLHTLVCNKLLYLTYRCLPISLKRSGQSPVTSTRHFHRENSHHFLSYRSFSVNSKDDCVEKSQKIISFWNTVCRCMPICSEFPPHDWLIRSLH